MRSVCFVIVVRLGSIPRSPRNLGLRAEPAGGALLLELFRDVLVRLEELCGAPVQAHRLALGQLTLTVRLVDALGSAELHHPGGVGVGCWLASQVTITLSLWSFLPFRTRE